MNTGFLRKFMPVKGSIHCRHCGSDNVRLSLIGRYHSWHLVYRCRACKHHFKEGMDLRVFMPFLITLVLFMIMAVGIVASLYYRSTAEDDRSLNAAVSRPAGRP